MGLVTRNNLSKKRAGNIPLKSYKAPFLQVAKVKKLIKNRRGLEWQAAIATTIANETENTTARKNHWSNERTYTAHYNPFFRELIEKYFRGKIKKTSPSNALDIAKALALIHGERKRPFVLVEDGVGKGFFFKECKNRTRKNWCSYHNNWTQSYTNNPTR